MGNRGRRASLHIHELVNCRWVEEVTQQLDTLKEGCGSGAGAGGAASGRPGDSPEAKDRCKVHAEKLSVYCWTCRQCICHQVRMGGRDDGSFQSVTLVLLLAVRFVGRHSLGAHLQTHRPDLRSGRMSEALVRSWLLIFYRSFKFQVTEYQFALSCSTCPT